MTPSAASTGSPSFSYRPDVDGLRALAVLPVLLFHAGLGCSGGFVGVDVFFVISGYVISSLILREIAAGSFSMVQFWERRIRRIMPALTCMVVAVLGAAWLFCLPEDFQRVGKSVLAQAVMGANFYFWKDGNYFDPGAETKPLLHTWSLAVEEQFYLLFPLLLTFLVRSRPRTWQRWLWGIALGSLVIGIALSYSSHNQRAAFYLLPARAWELLIGVLVAVYRGRFSANKAAQEVSGFLGLALIGLAVLGFDGSTRFPGVAALAPCLGAGLIIASSDARLSAVGRLLSWRPFVFIGLVSYPLYLWHWPLLVFAKYLSAYELTTAMRIGLLLASFVLAVLSWKLIETPFRQRHWLIGRRQVFTFAAVVTGVFIASALTVSAFKGLPARFPASALAYAASRDSHGFRENISPDNALAGNFTELGSAKSTQPIRVLVWGDSHAMAITSAIDNLCRQHQQRGLLAGFHSTAPVLHYISPGEFGLGKAAPRVAERVVAFIAKEHIPHVIMTAKWDAYAASAEFRADLITTVRTLMASGAQVLVLKDVPAPGFDVPRIAALTALRGGDLMALGLSKEQHQQVHAALEPTFDELAKMGATVIDPADLFLTPRGLYGVLKNDQILYFDGHHLTREGAELLSPLFKRVFEEK